MYQDYHILLLTLAGPRGFTISLDVKLDEDAQFGIGGSAGQKSFGGVLLDSKSGKFTIGSLSGACSFAARPCTRPKSTRECPFVWVKWVLNGY